MAFSNPDASQLPFYDTYLIIFNIFVIILGTYLITIILLTIFHVNFIIPKKIDPHASVAFENLIKVAAFLIAVGVILAIFGVNPQSIAVALGIVGFAIAFGMQNTIANIMAGFALAADKPFRIGDRIRVGAIGRETWGDVIDIGLNTTKIKTIEEEIVVIPNNYIASNEVWNYTKGSPIYALTFKVGISYGSSWRLAKKLIIEEMQKHPYVLRKPQSFVRIDSFGEFSMDLAVWAWLRNARDKDQIRSDLLEAIKDRFDAEGVEIPFPYRTIVYKGDMAKEKQLPIGVKFDNIRRYPSKGRDYFEVGEGPLRGMPVSKVVHEEDVKILTPVSGMHNAKRLAQYSMSLARKINGNVTALYVVPGKSKEMEVEGLKCLGVFEQSGANYNINVATKIEAGNVVEKVLETIDRDHINLVVIGGGRKAFLGKWGSESIPNEIIERSTVPVVTMPYKLKWY
jgi:small-conductance mechanosensitive channel/nucleotide-binding universal stress UspA family protein